MLKNTLKQILFASIFTGLAILAGTFANFDLFGKVCLVGIVIFLMPLFLRIDLLIISAVVSVVVVDVISGYGHYAWISTIVYSAAVLLIWLFNKIKIFGYVIGMFLAALIVVGGYFSLELSNFDMTYALKNLIPTAIEMSITFVACSLLYFPARILSMTIIRK